MEHLIPSIVAVIATFLLIKTSYKFCLSINLIDRPNYRKKHEGEVPLIGGVAIVFGFSLACLLSPRSMYEWRPLFVCLIPLAVIGIMDDHGDISMSKRLVVQILSSLVMIYHGNVKINTFGDLTGFGVFLSFEGLESAVTVFCVVGVVNALNLLDGIDGLCAAVSLVALGSILVLVKLTGAPASVSLVIYFTSALIAFLIVNLGMTKMLVNKVFLGDAGTTIIGFFLCWYLILMSNGHAVVFRPIVAVWILAVPIMDTIAVMVRRVRSNKSPFLPGRDHIHHLLLRAGFSSVKTLAILFLLSATIAGIGILAEIKIVPEPFMFYGILILFGMYYISTEKLNRELKTEPDTGRPADDPFCQKQHSKPISGDGANQQD